MLRFKGIKHINEHTVAIFGTMMLHGGMVAWAMEPTPPVAIKQQVIQISMVAPSSLAQEEVKAQVKPEPAPVTPPAPDGLKFRKKEVKKEEKKEVKEAHKASATVPTSGLQSPDATQKVAARTEPVFDAAYLNNPPPVYPVSARRNGVQGKVMLDVAVTAEGAAKEVTIARSSGSSLLDDAAVDAVRMWRFVPAHRGSDVVEARVIVPVNFKLN